MRLYHYTNIDTLALILKNKTIRFNRLDNVDDLEEGRSECSGIKIAQYTFVSCWTENPEGSIPLWRMYTDKGIGIRIGIDKDMFKKYSYHNGENVNGMYMEGDVKTLISPEKLSPSNVLLIPVFNDGVFYRKVQYVNDVSSELKFAISKGINGNYHFELSKFGAFKNVRWAFQQESRFVLNIYPNPHKIPCSDKRLAHWLYQVIDSNIPNSISYYDMDLDEEALNAMEIILCPNMSEGNKIIVESLCNTYLKSVKPKESLLNGVVNLK